MRRPFTFQELQAAWEYVEATTGEIPGPNGKKAKDYEADIGHTLKHVRNVLNDGRYHPRPLRTIRITDPLGKVRVLGIGNIFDRVVYRAVFVRLNSYDALLHPNTVAYRSGFNPKRIVAMARAGLRENQHFLCLDVVNCFPSVELHHLREVLDRLEPEHEVRRFLWNFNQAKWRREWGLPLGIAPAPTLVNHVLSPLDLGLARHVPFFLRFSDNILVGFPSAGELARRGTRVHDWEKLCGFKLRVEQEGVYGRDEVVFLGLRIGPDTLRIGPKPLRRRAAAGFESKRSKEAWRSYYRALGVSEECIQVHLSEIAPEGLA